MLDDGSLDWDAAQREIVEVVVGCLDKPPNGATAPS